ncbi:MAG: beta-galactosidase, partial [Lentisphaeria bacterium]|nr:beta-galactosidase [Lentisphaeria bacterium]
VMTVTAKITNAPANASLTLLHLKPMELPEIYWRGSWIWCQNGFGPNNTNVWFSKTIDLKSAAQAAQAVMTADDNLEFFINGKKVGDGSDHWASCTRFDIAKFLKPGKNDIVVKAHNVGAWGGFIGEIYIRENGVDRFYPTGKDWLCHIGGDAMPQKFTTPAFLLGPPPAPPWGTRTGYLYIGPKSRLELVNAGKNSFTVKVLDKVPADLAKLTFKTVDAEGKEKTVEGIITPSTGKWQPGKTVKVSFRLPGTADQDLKIRMASDVMEVKGDPVIATVAKVQAKKIPAPVTARIVGSGKRSWIEINGEKFNPIYYDGYKSPEKDWMLRDAVAGGCRIVRTGIGFDTIWAKPDKLDFTALDKLMDSFALNAPEVKVILQVKLAMPQWWCDANPDEVVRYDRDQPIRPYQDRQALASRRWLKEASVILRKLIRHILRSPYADRIFAIGLSEGWNSEWFWTYSDRFNQSAYSGYSFADYATFAAYLKERYKTNEAFAKAWNTPGLTFDNFTIPPRKELDRASVITLLDPVRDRKIIDWYIFRNRSIGEAIETFAKVVKEETQNRWLTGVYYGYFKMFSGIYHRLQSVGHLDVERLSRSPYVDIFWAPSDYNMRRPGLPDGIMQAAENLTSHGKLVVVEQDMRTFCENDHYEAGRMRTVELTVGAFERAFGLLLSRGVATHWLAMHESWFREKVLLDLMKHQQEVYASLPPVKGSVPADVCIVSDTASAFYTMHNLGNNLHRATVYQLVSNFNFTGTSFRHLFVKDLNEPGLIPPHKLYIMTNILAISDADRAKLMARFEREKATVLWLYAAGISTPDQGPSAQLMSRFLGINVTMDKRVDVPEMRLIPEAGGGVERNFMQSGPWFIAQSGFDKVLGRDKNGRPLLVKWQKGNVTHFFSTIMSLSSDLLRKIAGFSGAHIYNENTGDPLLAGNDVIFLHAGSGGKKVIKLPAGCKARAISGPIKGEFTGNITFEAVIGRTYGFHISK